MPSRYKGKIRLTVGIFHCSGKIIATSHDLGPQKVAKEGKSLYFRKIQVGEICSE